MKYFFAIIMLFVLLFILYSCKVKKYSSSSSPVNHQIWDSLLQKHVTEAGNVNYKGFIQDSTQFNAYLELLSNHHPNEKNWTKAEQLAYWINAYNAFTVKLIVDHYPVESIKDIKKGIPFVNSVWDIDFIKIEDATYSLTNIEHGILRKWFEEPRIHFAINCASISCPRLRTEAFTAEKLEAQLTDQAMYFLANPIKNKIAKDKIEISKIFKWFAKDFKKKGNLIDFLNQYAPVKIEKNAKKDFMEYNWNLNRK